MSTVRDTSQCKMTVIHKAELLWLSVKSFYLNNDKTHSLIFRHKPYLEMSSACGMRGLVPRSIC